MQLARFFAAARITWTGCVLLVSTRHGPLTQTTRGHSGPTFTSSSHVFDLLSPTDRYEYSVCAGWSTNVCCKPHGSQEPRSKQPALLLGSIPSTPARERAGAPAVCRAWESMLLWMGVAMPPMVVLERVRILLILL